MHTYIPTFKKPEKTTKWDEQRRKGRELYTFSLRKIAPFFFSQKEEEEEMGWNTEKGLFELAKWWTLREAKGVKTQPLEWVMGSSHSLNEGVVVIIFFFIPSVSSLLVFFFFLKKRYFFLTPKNRQKKSRNSPYLFLSCLLSSNCSGTDWNGIWWLKVVIKFCWQPSLSMFQRRERERMKR